jgi:hypothetical protein
MMAAALAADLATQTSANDGPWPVASSLATACRCQPDNVAGCTPRSRQNRVAVTPLAANAANNSAFCSAFQRRRLRALSAGRGVPDAGAVIVFGSSGEAWFIPPEYQNLASPSPRPS